MPLRIEVFSNPVEEAAQVLRLRMYGSPYGRAFLVCVDEKGRDIEGGHLLSIEAGSGGKVVFRRLTGVSNELPLDLDSEGRIEIK
jgi:hypothetical protein